MTEEIFIPKLGQTVEEVTLIGWLVEDGSPVNAGDDVLEVETDKAVFPIPATAKGILHTGPYKKGEVIPVLTVVAIIGGPEEKFSQAVQAGLEKTDAEVDQVRAPDRGTSQTLPTQSPSRLESERRVFISPRARKLAGERPVDLSLVTPTGGGGTRIKEKDVLAYLSQLPKATPVARKVAAANQVDLTGVSGSGPRGQIRREDVERLIAPSAAPPPVHDAEAPSGEVWLQVPMQGVRGITAERMAASAHTAAPVTLFCEADVSELVALRENFKTEVSAEWGFSPGYNDFLGVIVARTLKEFPYMNARLSADGRAIEQLSAVHLGMAVDTDRGLLVPVIRDADRLGVRGFGEAFRLLVERGRAGRLLPDDMSGGTFTITNLGMYDILAFTPIINLPECAILGVGRIDHRPFFSNGEVVGRHIMILSLTFDHRLTDGAPAARFLQRIKRYLEHPYLLLG